MRKEFVILILGLAFLAGCAANADTQLAKVNAGMTQAQVKEALGSPEKIFTVRFSGHEDDYLVWEYSYVPDRWICPTEAAGRALTGIATLGLSEIAWRNAQAEPHWIFFLDGVMMHSSLGFDCAKDDICTITGRIK